MKSRIKILLAINYFLILFFLPSCNNGNNSSKNNNEVLPTDTIKNKDDSEIMVDSVKYDQVKIGDAIWMTKNLDLSVFRNGDSILEAKTDKEWINANRKHLPAWCNYYNSKDFGTRYGKLYNYYAVSDPRGLAPSGWRIPTLQDWRTLFLKICGSSNCLSPGRDIYFNVGFKLKSIDFWDQPGSNEFKFNAIPGGGRWGFINSGTANFSGSETDAYWWAFEPKGTINSAVRIYDDHAFMGGLPGDNSGYSVRCLK